MSVPAGTWVEIERVLLDPEDRSPALPEETRSCPYVLKVSGFLLSDANVGDEVSVRSLIGREHVGRLTVVNPSYAHSFGATVPELLHLGLVSEEMR